MSRAPSFPQDVRLRGQALDAVALGHDRRVTQPVDLAAVLSTFTETWSPRTVATLNDYDLRVVRTHGEFTRHSHPETDEAFLVCWRAR